MERWAIWGEPEACRERLALFEDAGIRHVKLVIGAPDPLSQLDRILDALVLRWPEADLSPPALEL